MTDLKDVSEYRRRIMAEYLPELDRSPGLAAVLIGHVIGFEIRCGAPVWVAIGEVRRLKNSEARSEIFAHALVEAGPYFPGVPKTTGIEAMEDLGIVERDLARVRENSSAAAGSEASSDPAGDGAVQGVERD